MRRRKFIMLIGAASAWPLAARGQPAMPTVGYLYSGSRAISFGLPGFPKGLREAGYIEGQNVAIEYRFGEGHDDRLPALAAELVRRGVAVIFAADNAAAVAAKTATSTIPIVFWVGSDQVKLGLVSSLNRPHGNVTGISGLTTAVTAKKLQLLHDMVPKANVIALLLNPANPGTESDTKEAEEAARSLGLQLHVLNVTSDREIDAAFEVMIQRKAAGLVVQGDPLLARQSNQVIALAKRDRLPAIYFQRGPVEAGGLMSYAANLADQYRLAAGYVGRILKGEKPSDLPVQQATKMELVINRKTADALGITIPTQLEILADEVIE